MNSSVENNKLDLVLDITAQLTVRLGSCELPMREMLELGPGAVIQLNQRADDPVGLYVNEKLIARGEVVVMEEKFGIKITEIIGDRS